MRLQLLDQQHPLLKQALAAHQNGDLATAKQTYRLVLQTNPNHPDALYLMGVMAFQKQEMFCASEWLQWAVQSQPQVPYFYLAAGELYLSWKMFPKAQLLYQRALDVDPNCMEAHLQLALLLKSQGELTAAKAHYEKALKSPSHQVAARLGLAHVSYEQGFPDQAIEQCRILLQESPILTEHDYIYKRYAEDPLIHSDMIYFMTCLLAHQPQQLHAQTQLWAELHAIPWKVPAVLKKPAVTHQIRVGYVSPLATAMQSLWPLLQCHNRDLFNISVFTESTLPPADKIKRYSLAGLNLPQQLERLQQQQLDILVHIGGHQPGHHLLLFAQQTTPIQLTGLLDEQPTGLSYWQGCFIDRWSPAPIGSPTVLPLDSLFCWQPPVDVPLVAPAVTHPLTLGYRGPLAHLNPTLIACWRDILRQLPQAHLRIQNPALADVPTQTWWQAYFSQNGLPAERCHLQAEPSDWHFYTQIDLFLEALPGYASAITCEALWMGIPVWIWNPESPSQATRLLQQIQHPEWLATSTDDYIRGVIALAQSPTQREHLRQQLRTAVQRATFAQPQLVMAQVEQHYRQIWQQWLATQAP